jgi:transposase-like protein
MSVIKFYKKKGKGKRRNSQPYPIEFKLQIIREYQSSNITFRALSKKYELNPGLISYWVRRFENRQKNNKVEIVLSKFKTVDPDKNDEDSLKVKALEKALEEALLKNKALDKMIDIAEQELKINIRKKSGTKRSQQ